MHILRDAPKLQPAMTTHGVRPSPPRSTAMATPNEHKSRKRILVVDDHPAVRMAIINTINGSLDLSVCGEAGSGGEALALLRSLRPDAAVVDVSLEDVHGLDLVETMRAEHPHTVIIVFSMYDESVYAERALRAGASGYLMKSESTASVVDALRTVLRGDVYLSNRMASRMLNNLVSGRAASTVEGVGALSDREMAVFQMLGEGFTVDEISDRLHLARKTVEHHRRSARDKLGLSTTGELLSFAVQWMHAQGSARH